jgi:hypothetical protein
VTNESRKKQRKKPPVECGGEVIFGFRSVHDQVFRDGSPIALSELDSSPNSSPNCAPWALQILLCAPLYSVDNIGAPGFMTALLTEGL